MKTKIISTAIITVFCTMMTYNNFAQNVKNTSIIAWGQTAENLIEGSSLNIENTGAPRLNNLNIKAVRDFTKRFSNAENAAWHTIENAFIVKFSINKSETVAAYSSKGGWLYTVKRYQENKMPESVRSVVKPVYYDCVIDGIVQVNIPQDEQTIYVVYMHDDKNVKILRVCNGEMELIKNYIKG